MTLVRIFQSVAVLVLTERLMKVWQWEEVRSWWKRYIGRKLLGGYSTGNQKNEYKKEEPGEEDREWNKKDAVKNMMEKIGTRRTGIYTNRNCIE